MAWLIEAQGINPERVQDFLVAMAQVIPTLLIAQLLTGTPFFGVTTDRRAESGDVGAFFLFMLFSLGGMFVVLLGIIDVISSLLATAVAGGVVLFQIMLILIQPIDATLSQVGAGRWKLKVGGTVTGVVGIGLVIAFFSIVISRM